MIGRPPAIPASLGALIMLAGLGLIYWSLTGFGLLKTGPVPSVGSLPTSGGGTGPASNPVGGLPAPGLGGQVRPPGGGIGGGK